MTARIVGSAGTDCVIFTCDSPCVYRGAYSNMVKQNPSFFPDSFSKMIIDHLLTMLKKWQSLTYITIWLVD